MKATFLYPDSGISPHYVHKTWAESVGAIGEQRQIKTPMPRGLYLKNTISLFNFDVKKIPQTDVFFVESLYSLPVAAKYKKLINPNCKIIALVCDTAFREDKLSLARILFYKKYLPFIDGFIAVSEKMKYQIENIYKKLGLKAVPIIVVRPYDVKDDSYFFKMVNKKLK